MTYPPPGGTPDPYQPQQPYGQQPPGGQDPYKYSDPYASPSSGAPTSGQAYPPPPGQPYGQPYGQQYPPAYPGAVQGTNVMAILSLVFAFVFAPAGIVLGHIARKQIRQTGEQGSGLATAGLVVSYIITGFYALACCGVIVSAIASTPSGGSSF